MASGESETMTDANPALGEIDKNYFIGYEDLEVHELMLKDRPRTLAYKKFIEENSSLIKDKVVMDLGAGTGILSFFAAKAGAKKARHGLMDLAVYAVEGSKISHIMASLVEQNGYSDVIEVIHGRLEEITNLPENLKVDVIISEWMGFYLLHESMLDSLIFAREKYLSPDGIMLPSQARIFVCPVQIKEYMKQNFDFWNDVYGVDYSSLIPVIKNKAAVTTLKPEHCIAEPYLVTGFDLQFVTQEDIMKIKTRASFKITKNALLHGFAFWFDCEFEGENSVILDTSPEVEATHWQQTVILLPDALLVSKEEKVDCFIELSQDKIQHRRYNITIELDEAMEEGVTEGEDTVENGAEKVEFEDETRNRLLQALEGNMDGSDKS